MISYFPEFDADITDPRSRAMLVRHVASMASGHRRRHCDGRAHWTATSSSGASCWCRRTGTRAPSSPTTSPPPTPSPRSSSGSPGQTLTEYLRPRLLDPLGIGEVAWIRDRSGRELGFSGLHATTDASPGSACCICGAGCGRASGCCPRDGWPRPRAPRSPTRGTAGGRRSDWQQGYGFQFWMSRHGYRGDGAYGQFCLVLPEQDVVIAMTSETEEMQEILNLVWEHLLPAFGPEPLPAARRRTRPSPSAGPARAAARRRQGPHRRTGGGLGGAAFAPYGRGRACAEQPSLTAVEVDGWPLTLVDDGDRLERGSGRGGGLDGRRGARARRGERRLDRRGHPRRGRGVPGDPAPPGW